MALQFIQPQLPQHPEKMEIRSYDGTYAQRAAVLQQNREMAEEWMNKGYHYASSRNAYGD
jgi:hypothetical protein